MCTFQGTSAVIELPITSEMYVLAGLNISKKNCNLSLLFSEKAFKPVKKATLFENLQA